MEGRVSRVKELIMATTAQTLANRRNAQKSTCPAKPIGRRRDYYMQNKPNFQKSQMNVSIFSQKDYENISDWTLGENKPNQTQFQPKNEANKPKQTQFQPKNKADKPKQSQSYLPPAVSKAKITCSGIICHYNHLFRINLGEFLCVNNAAAARQTHSKPSKKR